MAASFTLSFSSEGGGGGLLCAAKYLFDPFTKYCFHQIALALAYPCAAGFSGTLSGILSSQLSSSLSAAGIASGILWNKKKKTVCLACVTEKTQTRDYFQAYTGDNNETTSQRREGDRCLAVHATLNLCGRLGVRWGSCVNKTVQRVRRMIRPRMSDMSKPHTQNKRV